MFYASRLYFWYRSKEAKSKPHEVKNRINSIGKKLYHIINLVSGSLNIKGVIDGVIKQLQKNFVTNKEEELLSVIKQGYVYSLNENFKPEKFLKRVWTDIFNNPSNSQESEFIKKTLKEQFVIDFMDDSSTEPKIAHHSFTYYQEKLKKWKDILSRRLSLKFAPQNLVEISKDLANFNYRFGLELPGQYLDLGKIYDFLTL